MKIPVVDWKRPGAQRVAPGRPTKIDLRHKNATAAKYGQPVGPAHPATGGIRQGVGALWGCGAVIAILVVVVGLALPQGVGDMAPPPQPRRRSTWHRQSISCNFRKKPGTRRSASCRNSARRTSTIPSPAARSAGKTSSNSSRSWWTTRMPLPPPYRKTSATARYRRASCWKSSCLSTVSGTAANASRSG